MSRCTKMGPGGNITTNVTNYIFNRYSGQGIGRSTIAIRNLKNKSARVCNTGCKEVTPTILEYDNKISESIFVWDGVTFTLDTSLPNRSFKGKSSRYITQVPFPGSLLSVTISNSITIIRDSMFSGCYNLANVVLPESVTSIGPAAFSGCYNLANVVLPESLNIINNNMFIFCSSLASIIIPNSVTSIGGAAFYGCSNLTNVTLSNTLQRIDNYTFSGSRLMSIIIPISVTIIEDNAFTNCSNLTTVTIVNGQLGIPSPAVDVSFFGAIVTTIEP